MNLSCNFYTFESHDTKGKSTGNVNTSAACSLVLYYMNGSDNKGKQNNISRVKVSVSWPLWRTQADASLCQGRRLVREWTASGVLCAAPQSLWRRPKCSGWPLTHAAINYCPLLSSVLNKGRDADKNNTVYLYGRRGGGE